MWLFAFMALSVIILKIYTLAQCDRLCTPQKSFDYTENKWPNALSIYMIIF